MRRTLIRARHVPMAGVAIARLSMVLVVALVSSASLAEAAEHAPRVLSPRTADAYSMRTFAEFPRWRDLDGDAKARACFSDAAGDEILGLELLSDPANAVFRVSEGERRIAGDDSEPPVL